MKKSTIGQNELETKLDVQNEKMVEILSQLEKEGFIVRRGRSIALAK